MVSKLAKVWFESQNHQYEVEKDHLSTHLRDQLVQPALLKQSHWKMVATNHSHTASEFL